MWTEFLFENKNKRTLLRVSNKSVVEIAFTFFLLVDRHPEIFLFHFFQRGEELLKSEEKLVNQLCSSVCHVRQINTITH